MYSTTSEEDQRSNPANGTKKIGNNSAGEGVSCSTAGRKKTVISFVASPQRACELLLFFILVCFILFRLMVLAFV